MKKRTRRTTIAKYWKVIVEDEATGVQTNCHVSGEEAFKVVSLLRKLIKKSDQPHIIQTTGNLLDFL